MFIDLARNDPGSLGPATVCIVGAGAAGITLARALDAAGLDVLLVESGGFTAEAPTQALYAGDSIGLPYDLASSRLRYFGGSTNHWGGLCRPLDDDDFAAHEWVPDSGWPITRRDLAPYYERAFGEVDIPHLFRTLDDVEREVERYPWVLGRDHSAFEPVLWWKSPPAYLGQTQREFIKRSPRIRCLLHTNVTTLVPNPDGTAILGAEARTLAGREVRLQASHFVLCAGGIENARLLLASDGVVPAGIGNRHDLVGRYFMDHPNWFVARMVLRTPVDADGFQEEFILQRAQRGLDGIWNRTFSFATTPAFRRRHRLLGCALHALRSTPDHTPRAADALMTETPPGLADGHAALRWYLLSAAAEQAPGRDSRVALGEDRDALGQRRVVVDLRRTPFDLRSIRKTVRQFATAIGASGHGRVQLLDDPAAPWVTLPGHHLGTTRMADDPRRGVTDRHGHVHGVANLSIAGSSLFPTAGYANPTLTIVALALRLADRLAQLNLARR